MKEMRYCTIKEANRRKTFCKFIKKLRNIHIISEELYETIADYLLW